ncbi:hypothetical protein D3C80_1336410 [compost metagenome]
MTTARSILPSPSKSPGAIPALPTSQANDLGPFVSAYDASEPLELAIETTNCPDCVGEYTETTSFLPSLLTSRINRSLPGELPEVMEVDKVPSAPVPFILCILIIPFE